MILYTNVKKCLYKVLFLPTLLARAEAWGMRSAERRKIIIHETKCLRSLVGVKRMNRVRNKELRRKTRIERKQASRVSELRWFGHVKKMKVPYYENSVDCRSKLWAFNTIIQFYQLYSYTFY